MPIPKAPNKPQEMGTTSNPPRVAPLRPGPWAGEPRTSPAHAPAHHWRKIEEHLCPMLQRMHDYKFARPLEELSSGKTV
jgi:hypothetical protein